MLCVIEGPDGGGKSTLAAELEIYAAERGINVERRHCKQPTTHPLNEYELPLVDVQPDPQRLVIYDRLHLGELVYGPLYRGGSKLDAAGLLHVELFLQARGALLVLALPDLHVLQRRLAARGEDFLKPEHVEHVLQRYEQLSGDTRLQCVVFDGDVTQRVVKIVMLRAQLLNADCTPLSRFKTYVGPRDPELLLLGETRGPTSSQATGRHPGAFTPFTGTSGHYLLSALAHLNVETFGLANACEDDVRALYETLGQPKVVALGRAAAYECNRRGVPHGAVPHPQYARRFFFRASHEYATAIVKAAMSGKDMSKWPR